MGRLIFLINRHFIKFVIVFYDKGKRRDFTAISFFWFSALQRAAICIGADTRNLNFLGTLATEPVK
jgi:hypothetical protein